MDNVGDIFGHFCNDLALDERPGGNYDISLHRISLRIFLDGSGLSMEPWRGHFLLPSWSDWESWEMSKTTEQYKFS